MGKGGEGEGKAAVSQDQAADAREVLIDGRLYDVANFKHPGGTIIKFLTGHGDATDAFEEFHSRSKKAKLILKSIPSRPAPKDVLEQRGVKQKLTEDYIAFRRQLEKEGYFDPSPAHVTYRIAELIVMHILGFCLLLGHGHTHSTFIKTIGVVVLGIVQGRCGWFMHEGGHYSATGIQFLDKALQSVCFGVGCGMSGLWWRNQHNKHHATPQKLKHDVDLETLPLVAFNNAVINSANIQKRPLLQKWLRLQSYLFIPFSCLLVALSWQLVLHPRHLYRTVSSMKYNVGFALFEMVCIATRYHYFFNVLLADYTWAGSLALYIAYDLVGAAYIFTNFALSHTHLPVSKPDEYLHWTEYASYHTTNISPSWLCNWWMSYLNFQIEHHLFPTMPQFRQPAISPRVKKFFEAHGLVYDVRPYFLCLHQTLANLHSVGLAAANAGQKSK